MKILTPMLLGLLFLLRGATAHAEDSITPICDLIGQSVTVSIVTLYGEEITQTVVVGDPADRCIGRCGAGCGGRNIYTQECLEHDVCEHVKGTSYGPCLALYKRAAKGFLIGPVCP